MNTLCCSALARATAPPGGRCRRGAAGAVGAARDALRCSPGGLVATRCVRCAHFAQTGATKSDIRTRCARAPTCRSRRPQRPARPPAPLASPFQHHRACEERMGCSLSGCGAVSGLRNLPHTRRRTLFTAPSRVASHPGLQASLGMLKSIPAARLVGDGGGAVGGAGVGAPRSAGAGRAARAAFVY